MTFKEFQVFKLKLNREVFIETGCGHISERIQRQEFEKAKLRKLIATGKQVPARTVEKQVVRWERMLARMELTQSRLQKLKVEQITNQHPHAEIQ